MGWNTAVINGLAAIVTAIGTAVTSLAAPTYSSGPTMVTVTNSSQDLTTLLGAVAIPAGLKNVTLRPQAAGVYMDQGTAVADGTSDKLPLGTVNLPTNATDAGTHEFIVASGTVVMAVYLEV